MKSLLVLCALVMLSEAQRPSYASSGPIGRPGLHSRFKTDNATSTSTTVLVENRVGEDGSTQKIPVDARGDVNLVNTLNSWDRDHRPYWLLNADHIERARNTTRLPQQTGQSTAPPTQLNNRNQLDSQSNGGSFGGSQGNMQAGQGGFQGNAGQGSFQGGQGRFPENQQSQTGRNPQRQEDLLNRPRPQYDNYHGHRYIERPSRFPHRRTIYV
ncbi:hypothetical protein WA026_008978 [Henosepilachna vigintioctopunctata]|uniref:Uncharacterized protein n=1 Tax=Henosepilachna vigintioctopunctata TaxID=420089 RepID=A0AAW1VDW2_9CUCU